MGACLAKVKTIGDDESKNASLESQMPSNGPAPSIAEAEARTPSDITAGRDTDSARPKSPGSKGQTKALKNDGDSKREKGGIFRSRAKLNGKVERPLQAMSSAELVEQYSIDASILMSSVERIDKMLKERQLGSDVTDMHDSQAALHAAPLIGNHISADSHSNLSPIASPTAEQLSTAAPEGESIAPSLDSLLLNDPRIAAIAKDFDNGRMLQVREDLKAWCSQHSVQLSELAAHRKYLGFTPSELLRHCERIENCMEHLSDESGYSTARDDGELKVLYKCEKGKLHHVKMESVLPHDLERPLSLAREFDLMHSWNHYIIDSQLLLAPSIWESYVYAAMWMPFPFPQMECLGTGRGYDLSREDRSLMVAIESIEDDELPAGAVLQPHKKKRHRANIMPGSAIRFEALPPAEDGTPRTKGTILQIVNPHVPHVPSFIVNFVLGVLAPFAHRQIVKLLADEFDSPTKPFPRRIAANPQLYQRVRDVVEEGLAFHYGVGKASATEVVVVS